MEEMDYHVATALAKATFTCAGVPRVGQFLLPAAGLPSLCLTFEISSIQILSKMPWVCFQSETDALGILDTFFVLLL